MGAVPLEEFADVRSEVHSLRRDLERLEFGENAILGRLMLVEREIHLVGSALRWVFGILSALVVALVAAILTKGIG